MLSYHADADMDTNPYELGMDRLVNPFMEPDFIGKAALQRIHREGVSRKQVGLRIDCAPLKGPNTTFWGLSVNGNNVGKVTSAVYSPRLEQNIALAMVAVDYTEIGTELDVQTPTGKVRATVVNKPFFDPKKTIASAA